MSGVVLNIVDLIPLIEFELKNKKMYATNMANTFENSKDLK